MLSQRKDSEIAPRSSTGSGRGEPAELRRARSKEFLIKKYSELCELCASCGEYSFTVNPEKPLFKTSGHVTLPCALDQPSTVPAALPSHLHYLCTEPPHRT